MKKIFLSVLFISIFTSNVVYAIDRDFTEVECIYSVERPFPKINFTMTGYARISNLVKNGQSYLTLEPPSVSGIKISARILLTRYFSVNYFPVSLHPRGNTVFTVASDRLEGKPSVELNHLEDDNKYKLVCSVL